jgi:hypothetical protein
MASSGTLLLTEEPTGQRVRSRAAGDQDLMEDLAKDRSYAGGTRYLLELMHRRTADNQTFEESRRYR